MLSQRKRIDDVRLLVFMEWMKSDHWRQASKIRFGSGERTGVAKGEVIGPSHKKILAAISLLFFGTPGCETLAKVGTYPKLWSEPPTNETVLRVWRSQETFIKLYTFLVWDIARFFIGYLQDTIGSGAQVSNFQRNRMMDRLLIEYRDYGVAVQRAILRILAQYLPKEFQEVPFLSDPFWRKEADWILGDAPPIPPSFQKEKAVGIAFFNAVFFSGDRLVHGLRHSWEERALLKEWHAKVVLGGINSEIKLAREAYEARNDEDVWRHLTYASVFSEKKMLDPILYWLSQIGSRPTFKGKHE